MRLESRLMVSIVTTPILFSFDHAQTQWSKGSILTTNELYTVWYLRSHFSYTDTLHYYVQIHDVYYSMVFGQSEIRIVKRYRLHGPLSFFKSNCMNSVCLSPVFSSNYVC